MSEEAAIHAVAWLVWLAAIVTIATLTRNPWYLGVTLLWILVTETVARGRPLLGRAAPLWSPLRFGLFVIPLAAIFNALTVHVGVTELWRLPLNWPLLGGAITLEAMLYGALNGLALTVLFGAFAVANRMLSLRAIIHLIPRTYYPVAVVAAIALTFVPVTLQQWQQIREAQAIRGHQLRGAASWLALWLPLLTGGMERALQLAEAMTARGFAGGAAKQSTAQQAALIGGLAVLLGGLLLYTVWGQRMAGLLLMLGGAGLVLALLYTLGRQHPHTRYRPMPWQMRDWVVVCGALVTMLAFLLPIPGRDTIYYTPYPALTPPTLAWTLGIALWGLLAPAAVWLVENPERVTQSRGEEKR
jgi:energy-coupling factor transport system permease protein